ncbi:MAG: hypothetical protein NT033_03175 [Candidatus Omnitrophica bacterium]|nr:hypothetical protein [Candidatus Omnitrophota bacterium]
MPKTFKLEILTLDKLVYKGEITSLVVPAELGFLGVLADHAPLVASLTSGKISLKDAAGKNENFVSGGIGFLEVLKNKAVIILDSLRI